MLLQAEADRLRTMAKRLTTPSEVQLPTSGEMVTFEAESVDRREKFCIDANRRGKIRQLKCTYLERYQVVTILARLDVGGPPHTNPRAREVPLRSLESYNGAIIPCPHLHFYVEGYEDRWAVPAPGSAFRHAEDLTVTLREFMVYCGVGNIPDLQAPLM